MDVDGDVQALIEAVETAFDVRFAPGELANDTSFDELCAVLRAHVARGTPEKCFTSIVFWRLRRACIELFGMSKSAVAPSTPIELVLPTTGRRRAWIALGERSGFRLPGLEYSELFGIGVFWVSGAVALALPIALGGGWWVVLLFALWPISATLLFHLLRQFADTLPRHTQTMGDLAKLVVGLNYGRLSRELGVSKESELVASLRSLVADLIDIDQHALVGENPRLIDLALANDGFRAQV